MSNNKTITYAVTFKNGQNQIHSEMCDFDIEHSRIDFTKCPIINEVFVLGLKRDFKINSLESIDVDLDVKNGVIPQTLANASAYCAQCKMKHRERENG